jgi:hypothetical protein
MNIFAGFLYLFSELNRSFRTDTNYYETEQLHGVSGKSYDCKECNSDIDCGVGNKCVKAEGDYHLKGCCVTPVNKYGQKIYGSIPSYGTKEVSGCSFSCDCPIGFECVKKTGQLKGICVKKNP